jgi:UDP-N-acetyl-D-glucosamine dehydrogenase
LKQRGAKVDYNDPHVPVSSGHRDYPELNMKSVKLDATTLKKYDAVIVATGHTAYDYDWIVKHAHLVIDTRNAIKRKRKNVVKA